MALEGISSICCPLQHFVFIFDFVKSPLSSQWISYEFYRFFMLFCCYLYKFFSFLFFRSINESVSWIFMNFHYKIALGGIIRKKHSTDLELNVMLILINHFLKREEKNRNVIHKSFHFVFSRFSLYYFCHITLPRKNKFTLWTWDAVLRFIINHLRTTELLFICFDWKCEIDLRTEISEIF